MSFFFSSRRRHTRLQGDWSSDVCSSDLGAFRKGDRGLLVLRPETLSLTEAAMARGPGIPGKVALRVFEGARHLYEIEIGGALPVRVEVPSTGDMRIYRLGDRVRVEVSSETVVLVPDAYRPVTPRTCGPAPGC